VRYAPDGTKFVSVSSDKLARLYDGKEGTQIAERDVHKGSIYACSWAPDSSKFATASGDKSLKLIDGTSLAELASHDFGKTPLDMVVGCAWADAGVVAYTLGAALSVHDPASLAPVGEAQYGHNQSINHLLYTGGKLLSCSFDSPDEGKSLTGAVRSWDLSTGIASNFSGAGHGSRVLKLGAFADGTLATLALDQTLIFSTNGTYGTKLTLENCPKDMAVGSATGVVIDVKDEIRTFTVSGGLGASKRLSISPMCVAMAKTDDLVAVGNEDNSVTVLDGSLNVKHTLSQHKGQVAAIAFNADGTKLASGCANKELVVWDPRAGTPLVTGITGAHRARISCFSWSPSGTLASAGVDSLILVWDLDAKVAKHKIQNAHQSGGVNALAHVNDDELASCGADACIKIWTIGAVGLS